MTFCESRNKCRVCAASNHREEQERQSRSRSRTFLLLRESYSIFSTFWSVKPEEPKSCSAILWSVSKISNI